jgi:hypothetical protein
MKLFTAIEIGRTVYHQAVKAADNLGKTERVIKRSTNAKLGKAITRGKWSGMPLYTVTLEERATCPKTCAHWATCYGNNMPFATRYAAGETLEAQITVEVAALAKRHPDGFAVRLHVLGDFYSTDYVALWASLLREFPALHVFGYTARMPGTPIGDAVQVVRGQHRGRFEVRLSGNFTESMAAVSMDDPRAVEMVAEKRAFICPEQTGKVAGCGACGLCWTADKPVAFVTH